MKRSKRWIWLAVALLLAGAWTIRYVTMNRYYDDAARQVAEESKVIYSLGDWVPLGNNRLSGVWTTAEGYTLRADGCQVMDFQDYLDSRGLTLAEIEEVEEDFVIPERLVVVHAVLANEDSEAQGVMLNSFSIHGRDFLIQPNWTMMIAANGLQSLGLSLSQQSQIELDLIFSFNHLDIYTSWDRMDQEELYLAVTGFPVQQEVRIQ